MRQCWQMLVGVLAMLGWIAAAVAAAAVVAVVAVAEVIVRAAQAAATGTEAGSAAMLEGLQVQQNHRFGSRCAWSAAASTSAWRRLPVGAAAAAGVAVAAVVSSACVALFPAVSAAPSAVYSEVSSAVAAWAVA